MGLSIGIAGLGKFARGFVELFRKHPAVDRLALCDVLPERLAPYAENEAYRDKLHPRDLCQEFDALCRLDLDAIAIFTQPWLHAPMAIQALESGKHVYSAVPLIMLPDTGEILDWCHRLVECCDHTGLRYMLGETTRFRPQTMFCLRQARNGAFGDFVYAEGEYMHDVDARCNLREVKAWRENTPVGREWQRRRRRYTEQGKLASPMLYPTHSVSGPLAVMNTMALKVHAIGFRNRTRDPYFDDMAFSNVTALFQLSNGASLRICEFRECAGGFHASETFRIMGTRGSFAENTWRENGRSANTPAHELQVRSLTDDEMRDPLPPEVREAWQKEDGSGVAYGGHGGSHAYLVHEFVDSIINDRSPVVDARTAAHYTAMGVAAHSSALRDGEIMPVLNWF